MAIAQGVRVKISREFHDNRMRIREDITNAVMLNVVCAAARRHSLDANKLSIAEVKQKSKDKDEKYTVGVLSSGGCLDTIASITHGPITTHTASLARPTSTTRESGLPIYAAAHFF